ncbi:MAG: hypothetical protein P8016_00365 [Sedimentisphaerales bacterium]
MNARSFLFSALVMTILSVPVFSAWTEPVPLTSVNDPYGEDWSPFLSFDGLTLYFARVRNSTSYYGRICTATRNDVSGAFTFVQVLDCPLNNSPGHQLCPWVSCDNLRMYYHNETSGRYRLMLSERESINDPWPAGKSIEELNSLGNKLQAPALTLDELIMVFDAYDIPDGKGNYDLWIAARPDRNSSFTTYRNLSEVNTQFAELGPFLSPDGLELYFSSNRNGSSQLFKATRSSLNGYFGNLEALSQFDTPGMENAHPHPSYNGNEFYFRRAQTSDTSICDIYVSYFLADNTYYVDGSNGDDSNNGTSSGTAFATIQRGIDAAPDGFTVMVGPGTYTGSISFHGKAVTLQGVTGPGGAPVLENPDDFAVVFANNEGPESVLKNVVIRNSFIGVFLAGSSPTLNNVTLVDNNYGIRAYTASNPDISNCVFLNNSYADLSGCAAKYSLTTEAGEGNIYANPDFADPNNGDYHLKSERGRYWPEHDVWVLDKVTSPCIDAGDPLEEPAGEPMPNGGYVNMGAYGGTSYASMSETPFPDPDFNKDGIIDESDLADLVDQWLAAAGWLQ